MQLDVGWGNLSALAWGEPGARKMLCLHGWMDNAASFEPLARMLEDFELVAFDFAGHGQSDHRPIGAHYYLTDYFFDLDAVLDALGWGSCVLAGHSLGTAVTTCYACANPQRVERLVLLDGLGVVTETPDKAGQQLTRSLRSARKPHVHRSRFDSIGQAAAVRQKNNKMSDQAAGLLAERALKIENGAYCWQTDARAMWRSPYYMTEAQSTDILSGIKCPALAVITPTLEAYLGEQVEHRLSALKDVTTLRLEGEHHIHMDAPELIAGPIRKFLTQEDLQHD